MFPDSIPGINGVGGEFRSVRVFTASGTYAKPPGLKRIKIALIVGGGGGGGGAASGGISTIAGNGGTGAVGLGALVVEAINLAASETVTIGLGGAGGAAGNNVGGAGGASSFGVFATAGGGAGGAGALADTTGANGADSGTVTGIVRLFVRNAFGGQGAQISNTAGGAASGIGSGGGGAWDIAGVARAGGAGAPGRIMIEEFF